jgi:hypothetical protein
LADEIEEARSLAFPILPVVRAGDSIASALPAQIVRLNALRWGEASIGLDVLRMLGLVERERRLFLSYRQAESSALALQLRRELSERSFDVFLDRFSVPPGADFQQRIDIELADKAFVLVIESPSAVGSDWVQHEVSYALLHQISVCALTTPGTRVEDEFPVVDEAFRERLGNSDFDQGFGSNAVLKGATLARVLDRIEVQYARQVRRRYELLLGSTSDFLRAAGYERLPLDRWALMGVREGVSQVFVMTANAPRPHDLRRADQLREGLVRELGPKHVGRATVVHESEDQDPDLSELVAWITSGRPLSVTDVHRLPEQLI